MVVYRLFSVPDRGYLYFMRVYKRYWSYNTYIILYFLYNCDYTSITVCILLVRPVNVQ